MEESASIDCARVVRGISSTAKAVSCRDITGSSAAGSSKGLRKPMTTVPAFSFSKSEGSGRLTQASTSAPESRDTRSVNAAPAALYSSSRKPALSPAPASITTSTPPATSFLTDSGVKATRASPGCRSTGTAILIGQYPLQKKRYPTLKLASETLFRNLATWERWKCSGRDQHKL